MDYDNRNTFVLYVNDKKGNDKAPDRTGKYYDNDLNEYRIAGWIKQGKNGPFLSGKIELKNPDAEPPNKPAKKTPQPDEDLPF